MQNTWKNTPLTLDGYEGFVYLITNKLNGKKYVGKKSFWKNKTLKPLKGKKNKRHKKIESDWKTYWGSSNQLLKDIQLLGENNFVKEIVRLCKSKWELNYYEAKLQFELDVLLRDDYYNGIINLRLPKASKKMLWS